MADPQRPRHKRLKVAVVTGTRAEFGLLRPVMDAVAAHPRLELLVVAGGAHLLRPASTIRDVRAAFDIAATVPMQRDGRTGRHADAAALGRGVSGFAKAFADLKPDWVVVLGDRIEALAAASAASVAGIAVCHIHGGDRAEGIADEAMRHAISKLAHLHCTATRLSARRLVRMGERPAHVFTTGSPAIDGLANIPPTHDDRFAALGAPTAIVLLHPWGAPGKLTSAIVGATARVLKAHTDARVLWLSPNHDAGRDTIIDTLAAMGIGEGRSLLAHLPRPEFVALLERLAAATPQGVLVGNSSAGLIEAAALGLPAINIGDRQSGRERARNVIDVPTGDLGQYAELLGRALERGLRRRLKPSDLFGDGHAGPRIADLLASTNPRDPGLLRKRNAY